jgi:hypothetical protein
VVNDGVGNPSNGCEAFVNAAAVNGKIALLTQVDARSPRRC